MLQELAEEIENTARAVTDQIHTALPGRISSVDVDSGMVSVQPLGQFITSDGEKLDYPLLTEVPLVLPFCQRTGAGVVFPVCVGDSCLIIVSEVELDSWRSNVEESEGSLRFDLSSAIAIPGLLRSDSRYKDLFKKASLEDAVMIVADDGRTSLKVSERGIAICGDLKVEGNISYTGNCNHC